MKVSRSQLGTQAKSKLDFYNILATEGQYYLPPYDECPLLFIRDIMFGKKKVSLIQPLIAHCLCVGIQELRDPHDQGAQLPRALRQARLR